MIGLLLLFGFAVGALWWSRSGPGVPVETVPEEVRALRGHRGLEQPGEALLVYADPVAVDEQSLVERAARILEVRVASARSFQPRPGDMIATRYTLEVRDRWKGGAASVHEVVLPGGVIGSDEPGAAVPARVAEFSGLPELREGAHYVLFLHDEDERGWSIPVGLGQGIVELDPRAGRVLRRYRTRGGRMSDYARFRGRIEAWIAGRDPGPEEEE